MRKSLGAIVLATALLVAAFGYGYRDLARWATTSAGTLANPQMIEFKAGTKLQALADELAKQGVVTSAWRFRVFVKISGLYGRFQAGTYRFEREVSPQDVTQTFVQGKIFTPVVTQLTIPEGFTLKQIAARFAAHGAGTEASVLKLATDPLFIQSLGFTDDPPATLEGFIYPATYTFTKTPSAEVALKMGVTTFWNKLPKDYLARIKKVGLTLPGAVTMASLIELETASDDEKPLISEVIWRRLKDKVPLAIDAALIYGIPDYDGDIRWRHLSDRSNPYNTRIHLGLPPTPVGAPSTSSLEAVLVPTNEGYYYYVLVAGSQKHHFSKTLSEHNRHVKLLLEAGNKSAPSRAGSGQSR